MYNLFLKIESIKIEIFFVIAGLIFGILSALITPPFQIPDEHSHFARAYQVSEGHLISEKRAFPQENGIIPYEYVNVFPRQDQRFASGGELPMSLAITFETASKGIEYYADRKYDPQNTMLLLKQPLYKDQKHFFHFANAAVYSPVPYIPQSIGIVCGRYFDLSPLGLMYLGRITNLAVWLFAIYFAIRLIPFHKHLVLLLALMPMDLFQAASLSADACLNGFSFLLTGLTCRMAYEKDEPNYKDYFILFTISLIVTLSKMAYLPLIGIILLIPLNRSINKKNCCFLTIAFIVTCLIAGVLWIRVADKLYIPYVPDSSSREQIQFILENPWKYISVIFSILKTPGIHLIEEYIGRLGWLDIIFPIWFYVLYVVVILGVIISEPLSNIKLCIHDNAIISLSILSCVVLVITTVYLYWSPVGLDKVAIQGRYFIPLGPIAFLLITNHFCLIKVHVRKTILYSFCLFSLCFMILQLIHRYYL